MTTYRVTIKKTFKINKTLEWSLQKNDNTLCLLNIAYGLQFMLFCG